ncbi:MAG: hypothetical protein AAF492_29295, partial [Verrucomicrobiota bacterium]
EAFEAAVRWRSESDLAPFVNVYLQLSANALRSDVSSGSPPSRTKLYRAIGSVLSGLLLIAIVAGVVRYLKKPAVP